MNRDSVLNSQNFQEFEANVRSNVKSFADIQKVWQILSTAFSGKSIEEIFVVSHTFFRLYCEFSWLLVDSMKQDFVKEVMAKQMVPMGVLLGFPVWHNLLWYMRTRLITNEDIQNYYADLQNNFLKSEFIVGESGDTMIVLKDVISKIISEQKLSVVKESVQSTFFSFPDGVNAYNAISVDEFASIFQKLVQNFTKVSKTNIVKVVDEFVDGTPGDSKPEAKKMSYIDIYNKINKTHSASDSQSILVQLQKFSKQYNDPTIETLYYYDESDNQFHWNEELLKK